MAYRNELLDILEEKMEEERKDAEEYRELADRVFQEYVANEQATAMIAAAFAKIAADEESHEMLLEVIAGIVQELPD